MSSSSNDYANLVTSDPEKDARWSATGLAGSSTSTAQALSAGKPYGTAYCLPRGTEQGNLIGKLDQFRPVERSGRDFDNATESCRRLQSFLLP